MNVSLTHWSIQPWCPVPDIGMAFGMQRRGVLILKRENVKKIVRITSPDNRKMKSVEEDGYKNLGILEYDDLVQGHEKNVLKKEYFWRLKTVQCQWENTILATNS